MKTGKSLSELAAEIERQHKTKKDYVAGTTSMVVHAEPVNENGRPGALAPRLKVGDDLDFNINDIAHDQIAEHTGIPKRYYDRMRTEHPQLLANNINEWFNKYPAPRLVRTLDGRARAFLSDKFSPLDNYDFAHAALPVLAQRKLEIMSCDITERKLYIKAVDTQLFKDVPVGHKMGDGSHRIFDTCAPVVILSNSEVGFGRLVIETGVYTRACTNTALWAGGGMKKTHVGAKHKLLDGMDVSELEAVLSDEAKRKSMEALWLQARDVIAGAFNQDLIGKRLEKLAATADNKITGKVDKVIEVVREKFSLTEDEGESIFKHLINGGSLTQYGLHAAITRSAQDNESYDRATELEYLGGRIIELPANDWTRIAEAA